MILVFGSSFLEHGVRFRKVLDQDALDLTWILFVD